MTTEVTKAQYTPTTLTFDGHLYYQVPLPEFSNYAVSETAGAVISNKGGKWSSMKLCVSKEGYLILTLTSKTEKKNNRRRQKTFAFHRLLYISITGQILDRGTTVDHRDNNKMNNKMSNFQLLSIGDNARKEQTTLSEEDVKSIYQKAHSKTNKSSDIMKEFGITKYQYQNIKYGYTGSKITGAKKNSRSYYKKKEGLRPIINQKLTDEEVLAVLADTTTSTTNLAIKYNVSTSTISNIKTGISYKHISRETPKTRKELVNVVLEANEAYISALSLLQEVLSVKLDIKTEKEVKTEVEDNEKEAK